jgi:hypothetical protein
MALLGQIAVDRRPLFNSVNLMLVKAHDKPARRHACSAQTPERKAV